MDESVNINKIIIVDDHSLVRDGMRQLVREMSKDVEILEACSGAQILEVQKQNPDVDLILLDLMLPDLDGFIVLEKLVSHPAAAPVIVVSSSDSFSDVRLALKIGAAGYIPKSESNKIIVKAIQLVMSGGVYVPPIFSDGMAITEHDKPSYYSLTKRQRDVLKLIMKGYSNRQIADALGLAEITIKSHVGGIFKCMNVDSRTKAALLAKELGFPD